MEAERTSQDVDRAAARKLMSRRLCVFISDDDDDDDDVIASTHPPFPTGVGVLNARVQRDVA